MPFTFSHPAAAIPLLRPLGRYGSLSALIIGSIAPDMAFIVPVDVTREQTHGLAALLPFCLPVGVLVYVLFHLLLKAPLAALLPPRITDRLPPSPAGPAWIAVPVSLLCGSLTHLAWDAFTHPGTPVVMAIPWLQLHIATLGGYQVFGYKLLQHVGTVAGLALLASWLARWIARTPLAPMPRQATLSARRRWSTIGLMTGFSACAGLWAGLGRCPRIEDMAGVREFAAGFVFAALPAIAFTLAGYSLLWQAGIALRANRP